MMNQNSMGGTISIEAHSKQVKLLNDYILSLEKKAGERKDGEAAKSTMSEEIRKLNEESVRLRNENSQMRYTIYKQEETLKRLSAADSELPNLRAQLDRQRSEKGQISALAQHLRQQLQKCEQHIQAAEKELSMRTEAFQREGAFLAGDVQALRQQLQQKGKECEGLREEKQRLQGRLQLQEAGSGDTIKSKNQTILRLGQTIDELKAKFSSELAAAHSNKSSANEQVRDLVRQLNDTRNELIGSRREVGELKLATGELRAVADKKGEELAALVVKLSATNEEKVTLLGVVRRLEEEKKAVENLHTSARGDISEQARARADLVKRNDQLSQELTDTGRQLIDTRVQLQGMALLRQQGEARIESLTKELLAVRAEAEKKRKELEENGQTILKDSYSTKTALEGEIRQREQVIGKLGKRVSELEEIVGSLGKQLQEANSEIKRSRESEANSQAFYVDKVNTLNQQIARHLADIKTLNDNLSSLSQDYQLYQKRKELEVQGLTAKIREFTNQKTILRGSSDTLARQYISYKNNKQTQTISLNAKIRQLIKDQTGLSQSLQGLKQEYQLYQKRKEGEVEDLSVRLRQLLKEQVLLKDNLDNVTRQYYTFQKKSQADMYNLNERLKEAGKKLQKKDAKIQQLKADIKEVEKVSESSRKNLDSSQREEMDRIKGKYEKEILELKNVVGEESLRNEQLLAERQLTVKNIQQLENKVRSLLQQVKIKEKLLQICRNLQKQRDHLLQQVKTLNLSSVMISQSKNSRDLEVDALKRSVANLQAYITEQRRNIDGMNKLMADKQTELEVLETSNAMLRKQIIASISNEEVSRKEVYEVRSRSRTGSIAGTSRDKLLTGRSTYNFKQKDLNSSGEMWRPGNSTDRKRTYGPSGIKDSLISQMTLLSQLESNPSQKQFLIDSLAHDNY